MNGTFRQCHIVPDNSLEHLVTETVTDEFRYTFVERLTAIVLRDDDAANL